MPFNIIRNDITKSETDAIVNAANCALQAGGGVCGAIFSAAGKDLLQKECDRIGHCNTGEAVITKGYNLKAQYIIHTVGPVYGEDPANEAKQLYSCYENSLKLAAKKKLKSIAFPVISSGIFGYPKDDAIKIATKAIKDFLQTNEMDVSLVVYDKSTFLISQNLFDNVQSYIDERLVKQADSRRIYESYTTNANIEICDQVYDAPKASMPTVYSQPDAQPLKNSRRSLESLLNQKTETFSEMLLRLIDEKDMTDVEVYKRANIDRKLFSKIRKKEYTPRKSTVIALAIGLRLNLDETRDLLKRAGFALSDWNKFDIIIEYFIENENYDIFEINEVLFTFDQQLLGA